MPKELLHPELEEARHHFLQGKYDTSIEKTTKKVETYLRQAINVTKNDHSTGLIDSALRPCEKGQTPGKLTDLTLKLPEQRGRCYLFLGFYMSYRNESHHNDIGFTPEHAARIIIQASELLYYIDSRSNPA